MNQTEIKPPAGYSIVSYGEVSERDILWDEAEGWGPASIGEVGCPVSGFKAVARPNGK